MSRVTTEQTINGDKIARVRFGAREWAGLSGVMLAGILSVTGLFKVYIDLRLSAFEEFVAGHIGKGDIHQSVTEKDEQFVTESEFRIWLEGHEKHPHNGVTGALGDHEARLRLLEQRRKGEK